jgi:hypothetical protein
MVAEDGIPAVWPAPHGNYAAKAAKNPSHTMQPDSLRFLCLDHGCEAMVS